MRTNTVRIGGTDYEVIELFHSSNVRFDIIPKFNETRVIGKEYPSKEEGIKQIQLESIKSYAKYVFNMKEAELLMNSIENPFDLRIFNYIYGKDGELKKSGFLVIICEGYPKNIDFSSGFHISYQRGKEAVDKITIESVMTPAFVDTSNYTQSDMFTLDNGMSIERYMST